MDREAREGVQGAEEEIHKRTSVSSTRLGQKHKNRSWCIGLCNGRGLVLSMEYEDRRWRLVAYLSKISQWDGEKLWNLWQGDDGNNQRFGELKALVREYKV